MLSFDDFIKKYTGKGIDYDGSFGNQCMDLYRQYVSEVLGYPQSPAVEGAKNVWDTYLPTYFERVSNTPEGIPEKGDIVIWSTAPYGHIAIFVSGTSTKFDSFDQNYPKGSLCHIQSHTYTGVLGWLKPKKDEVSEQDRIIQFLTEKEVLNEGIVREMYGAYQDKPSMRKTITDLQESLSAKLAVIQEKDRIISDLQTTIDAYQTQVKSYKGFIEQLAQKLSCTPDISEILGEAEQAIQNETKLISAIESQRKAEEKYLDAQTKETLSRQALVASEAQVRELNEELDIAKSKLTSLQKNYDKLKDIINGMQNPKVNIFRKLANWLKGKK